MFRLADRHFGVKVNGTNVQGQSSIQQPVEETESGMIQYNIPGVVRLIDYPVNMNKVSNLTSSNAILNKYKHESAHGYVFNRTLVHIESHSRWSL